MLKTVKYKHNEGNKYVQTDANRITKMKIQDPKWNSVVYGLDQ